MPKIAFIGAGSVVFAKRLIMDILSYPELSDAEIALMDINKERLELIYELTKKIIEKLNSPAKVIATLDRREALDGANYVINMIQVGGLEMFEKDVEIPRKYGIDQTVGDTIGPGGVFRGLRTIPVLLDIARDMEELCPDALFINYSNPMAINCWALNKATKIKNVGLCHSVQGTAMQLASYIGVPYEEVYYWVAGINHMAWFLEFKRNGEDLYPRLWQAMENPEIYKKDAVRFEIMKYFGYFVTESTHHMSEYVPYFRKNPERIKELIPERWDYLEICKNGWQPHYERIKKEIKGEEPIIIERSHEYASSIIYSMETNNPCRINGNVNNDNLITNLPKDCCVEVPCLVDKSGIHPCFVGDLPPQLAALNRTNINVQELAVLGALEKDPNKIYQAIMLDPLTSAILELREVKKMVDEMLEAEKEWIKIFE
ncbi:alpha-glucosidase/alpha-galactosidase [Dictyoglomus thermophilum]|uniref:Alpha-galactosidase n=1 Tax=Dictyoglomus thermophilum (strain ATCC 35947 / DSM 3960 / H-6-12) TaxID=309799 RepID=B5YC50_DICT6|nr:alpha-glucosidase/alpha-galactosidase [Dictyoglomus thermophilum]ACI18714.1 alpha-galactosidase [Dictyoglomus thermophilum H-6-12]